MCSTRSGLQCGFWGLNWDPESQGLYQLSYLYCPDGTFSRLSFTEHSQTLGSNDLCLPWNLADEVGMVEHTCNPSQAEAGGLSWTLCWKLELHSEFQASLCPGLLSEILALKRNLVSETELSVNNISLLLVTTFSSRATNGQFIEGSARSCSSRNLGNLRGRMHDFSKIWLMYKRQGLLSNLKLFPLPPSSAVGLSLHALIKHSLSI